MKILKDVVDDIKCDICGKSCTISDMTGPDYAVLKAEWGYGSPLDGSKFDIDICCLCFQYVIKFLKNERRWDVMPNSIYDPLEGKNCL
jgi:hypothetical protein